MSATFYGSLQALEIALRNAVNRQLISAYGDDWYDHHAKFFKLDQNNIAKLARAKRKLKKKGQIYSTDDIIADLSLGFWIKLFEHKRLWYKELHKVFFCENLTKKELLKERVILHERLDDIRSLRNRIAHHEPIFDRPNLEEDMANILDILGWLNPEAKAWVEKYERVHDVIKMRPPNDANLRF